jgi:hypothetical protein
MIVDHPEFVAPEDDEIKIWKYMDFTKLISLLETGCLFFSRADSFDDPFEGSYPRNNVEFRKSVPKELDEESQEHFLKVINNTKDTNKYWPRYTAISCWHMNEFESAAMWSLYLKSDEGIAIQSSYSKLKKSFEHESELRAVMLKKPISSGEIDFKEETIKKGGGVLIKVNIEELIDKIYVAPNAPKWFYELVNTIVKRYKPDIEILPSDINNPPMF